MYAPNVTCSEAHCSAYCMSAKIVCVFAAAMSDLLDVED